MHFLTWHVLLSFRPVRRLCWKNIWMYGRNKKPQNRKKKDISISGQTTCEMLVRFRQDVIGLHPRVVVILAGINDIAQNNGKITLANVLGNLQSMTELARAHGIKVALCSVVPCSRIAWRDEIKPALQVKQLNGMIGQYVATLASDDVIYVDYYSAMATHEGGLDASLSDDGCHPTPAGYAIMERVVLEALTRWAK